MRRLADRYHVIAPDLPGIGDSSIPSGEMNMKTAAIQIHDLVRSLGITKARVVGHDIGLMVDRRTVLPICVIIGECGAFHKGTIVRID